MTRFLAHSLRHALLSDLASNGYEWKDENGIPRIPEPFEQTTNKDGQACIYLGHVPLQDGTLSEDFCANVTDPDATFATEIPAPETPYNLFF
jgi:hypothetical protein